VLRLSYVRLWPVQSKFDESWAFERLKKTNRSPDPDSFAPTPRVVKQQHKDVLSADAAAFIAQQWSATMPPTTPTYASLVDAVRSANAQRGFTFKYACALTDFGLA